MSGPTKFLGMALLAVILIPRAFAGEPPAETNQLASEIEERLRAFAISDGADQTTAEAIRILREAVAATTHRLPNYQTDLAATLSARLDALLKEVACGLSRNYKNTYACERIIEMAENVIYLGYRPVARDPAEKEHAAEQSRQIETSARALAKTLFPEGPDEIANQALQLMLESVIRVRTDALALGFAQPLNDDEIVQQKKTIEDTLAKIAKYRKDGGQAPGNIRMVAKFAADRIRQLYREHEGAPSAECKAAMKDWLERHRDIRAQVSGALRQAMAEEEKLFVERDKNESLRQIRENDPRYIAYARMKDRLLESEGFLAQVPSLAVMSNVPASAANVQKAPIPQLPIAPAPTPPPAAHVPAPQPPWWHKIPFIAVAIVGIILGAAFIIRARKKRASP